MYDHIAVVHYQPAITGLAFYPAFLLVLFTDVVHDRIGQGVQHAVGGAVAQHKVIGERCDVFEFEQQDVFALLVFQGVYDGAGKFKCVQMSPRILSRRAEVLSLSKGRSRSAIQRPSTALHYAPFRSG